MKHWLSFEDDDSNATAAADVRGEQVLDLEALARIGHVK